jgi:small subunit ribosomal protein S17
MESKRKSRLGQVVSNKMNKTVVVAVETPKRHPIYKKTLKRVVRYKAHDEKNKCQVGDKVIIVETRPFSREKRWRVAEIVAKAEVVEISPLEIAQEDLAKVLPEKKAREEAGPVVKAEEATGAEVKAEAASAKPAKKAKEKVAEPEAEEKTEKEKKKAEPKTEKKAKEEKKKTESKAKEKAKGEAED